MIVGISGAVLICLSAFSIRPFPKFVFSRFILYGLFSGAIWSDGPSRSLQDVPRVSDDASLWRLGRRFAQPLENALRCIFFGLPLDVLKIVAILLMLLPFLLLLLAILSTPFQNLI